MEKLTVKRMYEYFLTEIRKDYTGTVTPFVWNVLMKDALQEWKAKIAREIDLGIYGNAEQAGLSVATDGINLSMIKLSPITLGDFRIENPMSCDGKNEVTLSVSSGSLVIPSMFRRKSVFVGYSYAANETANGLKCTTPCYEATSHEEADIINNFYRRPSLLKSYYVMGSQWRFLVPDTVKTLFVNLSYIKEPFEAYYDVQSPSDRGDDATGTPYTQGNGSVNMNISEEAKREVINTAVKNYLKNINDQRYQAYLQEQVQRLKG